MHISSSYDSGTNVKIYAIQAESVSEAERVITLARQFSNQEPRISPSGEITVTIPECVEYLAEDFDIALDTPFKEPQPVYTQAAHNSPDGDGNITTTLRFTLSTDFAESVLSSRHGNPAIAAVMPHVVDGRLPGWAQEPASTKNETAIDLTITTTDAKETAAAKFRLDAHLRGITPLEPSEAHI